jgi:signal peptidase I
MNRKNLLCALGFACLVGCGGNVSSGDRVLVAKCLYDTHVAQPRRYEVVVFKYPKAPVEKNTPKNYIKRLIGLPGEIIAIFFGRLYRCSPENGQEFPYRKDDKDVPESELWMPQHDGLLRHDTDAFASKLFDEGKFEILRKPPSVMMALRRIVFDNNHQPSDLVGMVPPRWNAATAKGWKASEGNTVLAHTGEPGALDWLRYQNLVVDRSAERPAAGGVEVKPQLITDRLGYNSIELQRQGDVTPAPNWATDLMLDFDVDVQKPQGELYVELSRGLYRYQARFNLADGVCTLWEVRDDKEKELEKKATRLKGPGNYLVRFANFDSRLTVWVDREMPFGDGFSYPPPEIRAPGENISDVELAQRRGPTENDLQPASVGSKGAAVTIRNLRLWRDTYYTTHASGPDAPHMTADAWANPAAWKPLQEQRYRTLYTPERHYLCLGDNSTASSDSREWGLVPQRLLLGRALAVYYPLNRIGPIR